MGELYDSKDQTRTDYETFKEYLFDTQRDKDNEVNVSTRLETWQANSVKYLSEEFGANKTTILNRLYHMGTKVIRDCLDLVEHIGDMRSFMMRFMGHPDFPNESRIELNDRMDGITIDPGKERRGDRQLSEPQSYKVKDSIFSEVRTKYNTNADIKSSFDRFIIAGGMTMAESLPDWIVEQAEEMSGLVRDIISEAVRTYEDMICESVDMLWDEFDPDNGNISGPLKDIAEEMETHNADKVMEKARRIELIESGQ